MKRLVAIIFLIAVYTVPVGALPDQESVFSHLSVADGLSQCTVSSIVQDSDGFIWIATFNGVNKYDGYDFKVYRHIDGNDDTIAGSVIRKLYVDSYGTVWAGTNKGLSWYDSKADVFRNLLVEEIHNFFDFIEISDSEMIVSSYGNTFMVNVREKKVVERDCPLLSLRTHSFTYIKGKDVLAGTHEGKIYRYSPASNKLELLPVDVGNRPVMAMLCQTDDIIWVATEGNGLFRVDLSGKRVKNFRHKSDNPGSICSNYVRGLCFDSAGKLWVATGDNLSILDPRSEKINSVRQDPAYPHSLSHASVKSIFRDRTGGMWLGTYFGGVNYYHPLRDNFRKLHFNGGNPEIIGCIDIDSKGDFWIGTNRNGVIRYTPSTGVSYNLPLYANDADGLSREVHDIKVVAFTEDESSAFIGAAFEGVREYRLSDGKVIRHRARYGPQAVHSILFDSGSGMWIGSLSGLFHYDRASGKYDRVNFSELTGDELSVLCLKRDSMGEVWIGAESGLVRCLLKFVDGCPVISSSQYFQDIRWAADIYESSDKVLWIASMDGLYRFDRYSDTAPVKQKLDGLRCEILRGIEEDSSGRLWLSTEDGLSCYNPGNGTLMNYSSSDGLPGNVFTMYSHAKDAEGNLYFGGLDGIVWFSPEHIKENNSSPTPVITGIVAPGSPEPISVSGGSVTLGPELSRFAVRFSVMDYPSWRENRFQYRMRGLEKEWNEADVTRTAYYSNLPKGHYIFEVRSSNNSGLWCEHPAVLKVTIRPVWYRTTFVEITFIILILASIIFLMSWLVARNEKKNRIEIGNLRARLYLKSPGSVTRPEIDFLNAALEVVEANLSNERFSVEEMASKLNVSRTNLHTKIKAVTGDSALALIKKVRFEEASRLLKETDIPIADVGSNVGFSSPTYFATNFKAIFGMSPKDYRKKYKI